MPVRRCLLGGVVISGLIFVSFLVYVERFSPYFELNVRSYVTTYRYANSTTAHARVTQQSSLQGDGDKLQNQDVPAKDLTRTSDQNNSKVVEDEKKLLQIVINNNMTTNNSSLINETIVLNNRTKNTKEINIAISTTNSTKTIEERNSSSTSSSSTVLNTTTKHFDRPNPDLNGYVMIPNLKEPLDIHCSVCAIVSSSGQMLGTKAGKEIDKTPCVIRMNDAPVKSYEADVGTRTTIRVMGHSASGPLKRKQRALLMGTGAPQHVLMWGPERNMRTDGRGYGYNTIKLLSQLYKGTKFYILTQKQMAYADKSFETETGKNRMTSGSWLTTGWFTIQLARNICDEIHMYGMISDDYCKKHKSSTPYHYYEPRGAKECHYYNGMERQKKNAHRFITEKGVYASWAKRSPAIIFHHPTWEPSST